MLLDFRAMSTTMDTESKKQLEQRVIISTRLQNISSVLFRNAVGDKLGVNATDMECLGLLFFKGIATPTELARHTGLTTGSTTAMLDRLEKAGLIERKPNPKDRRGLLITTREESKAVVPPLFAGVARLQEELVASCSEQELAIIANFLEKYTAIYDQERQKL
jgi:DNA-binding MarR family transcriptional regulator